MLKISVIDSRTERRLVLEGNLIAPWVAEVRTRCKAANGELEGRASVVDLRNVTIISQEGQIALLELMSAGAKFRCSGVLIKHVLKQLARNKQQESLRRITCWTQSTSPALHNTREAVISAESSTKR